MDWAIVRGKVIGDPQFVKNDGQIRCQFLVGIEATKARLPDDTSVVETVYTSILATTDPELTERYRALLDKGDEVLATGEFGFHKGRLKMRVKEVDLPDVVMAT